MNYELISAVACGLIALWATWCVLCGRVKDGIVGKLIYSAIAISGFVVMLRSQNVFFGPTTAGMTLHVSLALAGIRHIFMVIWWQRVKAWLCRTLNCEHYLDCNKGHVTDDQRKG